jgi:hypothetical protein
MPSAEDEAIEFAQEALEEILAALSSHNTFRRSLSKEGQE